MDEKLYQSPELSTSSLPPAALMSTDHGDLDAIGHCAMTPTHTQSRRHLQYNQNYRIEKKRESMGSQYVT